MAHAIGGIGPLYSPPVSLVAFCVWLSWLFVAFSSGVTQKSPVFTQPGKDARLIGEGVLSLEWKFEASGEKETLQRFELERADNPKFTNPDTFEPDQETAFEVTGLKEGVHHFRVRAILTEGQQKEDQPGPWSETLTVEVSFAPVFVEPASSLEGDKEDYLNEEGIVPLEWSYEPDTEDRTLERFELERARDRKFSEPVTYQPGLDTESFLSGLEEGDHFIRVRAVFEGGTVTPWSKPLWVKVNYVAWWKVWTLMGLGAVVFVATVIAVILGAARANREVPDAVKENAG